LQEAIALLQNGVSASSGSPERGRWQAALLRAELEKARGNHASISAQRLRLRDLHARYAHDMQVEESPEVLAAWVELLCAVAEPLVGNVAQARYRDVDEMLARLSSHDTDGYLHAAAWMKAMRRRWQQESDKGKRELLKHAQAVLEPCVQMADPALRLEASGWALAQAAWAEESIAQKDAYARALELARPVTTVPSHAVPALGCALKVSLATREDLERRVFATSLHSKMPDDVESLGLLAKSAYRDGKSIDACQYLEQAVQKHGAVLSDDLLALWREASAQWIEQHGRDEACQRNQRKLSVAMSRRMR
jgi:hypothetical protein